MPLEHEVRHNTNSESPNIDYNISSFLYPFSHHLKANYFFKAHLKEKQIQLVWLSAQQNVDDVTSIKNFVPDSDWELKFTIP